MNTPILTVENLTHIYSMGTPFEKTAVSDISFSLEAGSCVALIGHTGSGKSTLIQHLNALVKPTFGRVLFEGADENASKENMKKARFGVGLVFQYPEYQLFEETVYKDIAFGPKNRKLPPAEIDRRVREAARFVGVDEALFQESPFELSGGQKRRIAIAGVIAMEPKVLILDEPMAGLDPQGRESIMENLMEYRRQTGAALLIVTHSMDDAARYAERMLVLSAGKIVMDGTPAEVFSRGEELERVGLTVPTATKLAMELKKRGVALGETVYTVEALQAALLGWKEAHRAS
ncbi:MAG: energy-coupling factor transporter ATPase [bacterium]